MNVQNIARAGASFLLVTILSSCGAVGAVNTQQSGVSASNAAATQTEVTVVVTRTVLVTSTVFATVSVGTSVTPATTAPGAATALTSTTEPSNHPIGLTPTAGAATALTSTAESSSHSVHVTPTPAPSGLAIGDAANVTLAFLDTLYKDHSGASSMPYLSTRLQAIVRGGHSISSLIGVPGMYLRYQADAAISRGGGRAATVVATLTYSSGPVQRLITLIPEAGSWRIDDIADNSA